ncbi:MAG: MFS transporter [Terrisporobacter sp.]
MGRRYDFEYGKSRMWGSLGWAAATFFAGQLFNIDPNINFWIASASAIILFFIILSISIEITDEDIEKADSVKLKDVYSLFKLKDFWFFILYVIGVTCFYNVYDQQFPIILFINVLYKRIRKSSIWIFKFIPSIFRGRDDVLCTIYSK